MRLTPIEDFDGAASMLYALLAEREPEESISHKAMPTFKQHCEFLASEPYAVWYIIDEGAGAVYLSKQDEIGIGIMRAHQRKGLASQAIQEIMRRHPRKRYLANINPHNLASLKLFGKLGFLGPIQVTLEKTSA
jgi:RimJ/RimL family protein N-acetyltransferase